MHHRSLVIAAALSLTSMCQAHEFWIEPSTFHQTAGQSIAVQLKHGERFMGQVVPRDNAAIVQFAAVSTDDVSNTFGLDGRDQSLVRINSDDAHVVVFQSNAFTNTLDAEHFERYLKEEGLDSIIGEREVLGEQHKPGRERYFRCAKSVLSTDTNGTASASSGDFLVGLPLEILLLGTDAGTIRAQVLRDGAPLVDTRVVAVCRDAPEELFEAWTDNNGEIEFAADTSSVWMLTTIVMERVTDSAQADWQSYWASSTFETVD